MKKNIKLITIFWAGISTLLVGCGSDVKQLRCEGSIETISKASKQVSTQPFKNMGLRINPKKDLVTFDDSLFVNDEKYNRVDISSQKVMVERKLPPSEVIGGVYLRTLTYDFKTFEISYTKESADTEKKFVGVCK